MKTLCLLLTITLIQQISFSQSSSINGDWVIQFFGDQFLIHDFTIQNQGSTTFLESIQETVDGQDLHFTVQTAGVSQMNATGQFVFAGAGSGVAAESRNYRAVTTVAATGFGSKDHNLIAGIWLESQLVNLNTSPVVVNDASPVPFVLKRAGSTPTFSADGLNGTWTLTMNDELLVIDWSGMLELTREGVFVGHLQSSNPSGNIPLGGVFSVEGDTVSLQYSASVSIPAFGVVSVDVVGSGTVSEDKTSIDGDFTVTVMRDDSGVSPQQVQNGVFNGSFSMQKQAQSNVDRWKQFN